MYKQLAPILALANVAVAQTTASIWFAGFYDQTIEGSIITSDATATTYSINCVGGADANNCMVPTSFTFTQGPSTIAYTYVEDDTDATETISLGCQITSSISGVCSVTGVGNAALGTASGTGTTVTSSTTSITDISDLNPTVITLTAGAAASSGSSVATQTSSSTGSTVTSTSSGSTGSSGSTAKSTGSSKTSTSASGTATGGSTSSSSKNGASPMITKAPWVAAMGVGALALAAL